MVEGSGKSAVVLVVDDDLDHCMMLELALQLHGHRVITATSVRDARDSLQREAVDALVCDLTLGDGTALDVMQGQAEPRPRISVVLSGFDSEEDRRRSLAAGFHAHLVKPTPVATLLDLIARAMGGQDAPSAVAPLAKGGPAPSMSENKRHVS